jgi:uncharacterized membrane protein
MRRDDFLKDLEKRLAKLPEAHRQAIMADYAEHFDVGAAKGKSDADIAAALGTPRQIAAACVADLAFARVAEPQNPGFKALAIVRAMFAAVGLAFFNGVFMLGPVVFLTAVVASFWMLALVPLLLGGMWIVQAGKEYGTELVRTLEGASHVFFSLSMVAGGALLVLIMVIVTQAIAKAARRYIRLNLQVIGAGA